MASRAIQRKLSASWLSSDFSNLLGIVVFLLGFGGVPGCKFLEKKCRFWSSASIFFLGPPSTLVGEVTVMIIFSVRPRI